MALGRGNASAGACAAVTKARVPVVVASRCPVGATAPDYATGQRLADAGAVFAGDLGPSQARILLASAGQRRRCGRRLRAARTAWAGGGRLRINPQARLHHARPRAKQHSRA
jgi:hypothetical protein